MSIHGNEMLKYRELFFVWNLLKYTNKGIIRDVFYSFLSHKHVFTLSSDSTA